MPRKRGTVQPSGHTILIVDDQEETLVSSRLLLEREGHRLFTATTGADALASLRNNSVNLVIADYFMPMMNGEELVREIRKFDEEVQIILQTGYSGEKPPRQMLRSLDIQGYHDKLEGPDRLLLWVDTALKTNVQLRKLKEKERQLVSSEAQLRRLSAHILTVQEEERARISRELHDQLGQLLTAINLNIEWSLHHCPETFAAERERLGETVELTRLAIKETRDLCTMMRAGDVEDFGLEEALRTYAMEFARRSGVSVEFASSVTALELSPETTRNVFRIAQEALNNINRHAFASNIVIDFSEAEGWVVLTIADDGRGFDSMHRCYSHGLGLLGMRERARLLRAQLEVNSAPQTGTTVKLKLPADTSKRESSDLILADPTSSSK
jgi:signal transduction histidine kinase